MKEKKKFVMEGEEGEETEDGKKEKEGQSLDKRRPQFLSRRGCAIFIREQSQLLTYQSGHVVEVCSFRLRVS